MQRGIDHLVLCVLDLEAAATALSSLSFGLASVDQLVFGANCERLKRVTRDVTRVYVAGLAQKRTARHRESRSA